ncbi:hypothetical protein [Streptomyces sp. NPDC023327]|uniref:hypothetical protein n=1 Tax=Streptomyces sp. NPDC023327 TaxID=3157088 RepID=UPI0033EAA03A
MRFRTALAAAGLAATVILSAAGTATAKEDPTPDPNALQNYLSCMAAADNLSVTPQGALNLLANCPRLS